MNLKTALHNSGKACAQWGVWPALVMVLCQWEAARLGGYSFSLPMAALTASGTLGIYGADRWLERRTLQHLEDRHVQGPADFVFAIVALTLAISAVPQLPAHIMSWLLILGGAGALYLVITVGILRPPSPTKEVLGACILSWLSFGWLDTLNVTLLIALFMCGFANFLNASYQDRHRDAANGLNSLAVRHPGLNVWLAKGVAATATFVFLVEAGWYSPFVWVCVAHTCWPPQHAIDGAFLPLLATPFLS